MLVETGGTGEVAGESGELESPDSPPLDSGGEDNGSGDENFRISEFIGSTKWGNGRGDVTHAW